MSLLRRPTRARATWAALLLSVSAVLGSVAQAPAQAVTAAPSGLRSEPTGTNTMVLSWEAVAGASRYVVQGSTTDSFASLAFNQTTVNTRYVPTRVLSGALYWRVQAVGDGGASAFATEQASANVSAPVGLTVTNGRAAGARTAILPPVDPPVLQWTGVPGATGYDVEVDAEGDDVGGVVRSGLTTTTYVWPDPQGVGEKFGSEDFHARVRATFPNGIQSSWSPYVSYEVEQLPAVTSATCGAGTSCAPGPDGGPRDSVTLTDVVLEWDPVQGAKEYELWVAKDRDFNNQVERRTIFSTRYSPATTYANGDYFWKVRPVNAAGQPAPWPVVPNTFLRRWTTQPTLVHPSSDGVDQVGDDFYYQWDPVDHATTYRIEVGSDPNFTPGTYDSCLTAGTTYTAGYRGSDRCMPDQGALTYWRVVALDAPRQQEGIYSSVGRFVYDSGTVQRTAPLDGAAVDVPTLRWAPAVDAVTYDVVVKDATGAEAARTRTHALSWTPPQALTPADGPFTWTVTSVDDDGHVSPTPPGWRFGLTERTAGTSRVPTPLPGLSEPVAWRFPQLRWSPVVGADYYRVRVSEADGYALPESATPFLAARTSYPTATDTGTYFLRSGRYTWWVEAFDKNGASLATGPTASFTVATPSGVAGQRIALDGKALDANQSCSASLQSSGTPREPGVCGDLPATPVLDWEPLTGAGGYLLYLAEDPDIATKVLKPYAITTNSRWTPTTSELTALADNQSGKALYWFVRPCVGVTPTVNCGPDPSSRLDSATNAFRKVSPRVVLSSPAADAVERRTEVTFAWEDYRTTNTRATFAGGDRPSHQSAMQYRLQVSRTAEMTDANAIDDVVVDQTTYTAPTRTYPEGDLWWRVQAIDASGNRLAWSEIRRLKKETTASVPLSSLPSGSDQLLRWEAADLDASWRVEVYRNDDATFSPGNLVATTTTRQAAYVLPSTLPASDNAYVWRVLRFDATGQPDRGRWSDPPGRFRINGGAVRLTSPTPGASESATGPLLTWQEFASGGTRAAYYGVDVRNGAGASIGSVQQTSATAWAPPVAFPSGSYRWKVTAFGPSGAALATSVEQTFTTDNTLAATAPAQVASPQGTALGAAVSAVAPTWNRAGVAETFQWLRSGAAIRGATDRSYVVSPADVGQPIAVRVTGQLAGYESASSTSGALVPLNGGALPAAAAPTITGSAIIKGVLTAAPGQWPGGATFVYQWLRDGAAISGATGRTYTVQAADAGRGLTVHVTASAQGYAAGQATSGEVRIGKVDTTTTLSAPPKISRKARAKVTVTVVAPGVVDPTGALTIYDGAKKIASAQLAGGAAGKVVVKLKKLKPGKHQLKAVFSGSDAVRESTSGTRKIVVVKKG